MYGILRILNFAVRPNDETWDMRCRYTTCKVISLRIQKKLAIGEYGGILSSFDAVVHC